MLTFRETKIAKKRKKMLQKINKKINIWDVYIDNIVISNSIKTKTISKYLIGYLDKVVRP